MRVTWYWKLEITIGRRRPYSLIPSCSSLLDDEQRLQEELQDLIDDNPVEEDSGSESDTSRKRKKSDDDDDDDRFEDEDWDLIEENLGVKVKRVSRFYAINDW